MKVYLAIAVGDVDETDEVLGVFSLKENALLKGELLRYSTHIGMNGKPFTVIKGTDLWIQEWEVQ